MFIGHFAVALAAKKAAPNVSLGILFMAAEFVDLLWPLLLLLGVEGVRIAPGTTAFTPLDFYNYPVSHSLLMAVVWSLVFGGVYFIWRKQRLESVILGLCVLSHWILDLLSHKPDLPLVPGGSESVGLGLWNSVPATLLVETILFAAGTALYLSASKAKDHKGITIFWSLIVFLYTIYLMNAFGPPPPDTQSIAYAGFSLWLLILFAWWADRHRTPRTAV